MATTRTLTVEVYIEPKLLAYPRVIIREQDRELMAADYSDRAVVKAVGALVESWVRRMAYGGEE